MSAKAVATKQKQQQKQIISVLFSQVILDHECSFLPTNYFMYNILKALHGSSVIYYYMTSQSRCFH